jgi:hypothetical protein
MAPIGVPDEETGTGVVEDVVEEEMPLLPAAEL